MLLLAIKTVLLLLLHFRLDFCQELDAELKLTSLLQSKYTLFLTYELLITVCTVKTQTQDLPI